MSPEDRMRLVCISDTHMSHKDLSVPEGDVLIHAGDATGSGLSDEVARFLDWFDAQPHPHKILIAGNHDWLYQRHPEMASQLLAEHPGITYLEDSGIEISGVRFWGSPWQPWFCDWAFNLPRKGKGLRDAWNRIPIDTDVLITHGPPYGILDQVDGNLDLSGTREHLGCEELAIRIAAVRPKVHVFGHIHGGYGVAPTKATTYVNACSCTEAYRAQNSPIVVDLQGERVLVQGTKPNQRKLRLENIKALLVAANPGLEMQMEIHLSTGLITAMKEMARLRDVAIEELYRDYLLRGLNSDVAKELRVERKGGRRSVPLHILDQGEWPEGYWDSFGSGEGDFPGDEDES